MKKSDLKDGMIVKTRRKEYAFILFQNLHYKDGFDFLENYNDDLTNKYVDEYDIIEVYDVVDECFTIDDIFENLSEPIWVRDGFQKWDRVLVSDNGEAWYKRYYIGMKNTQYEVTVCDKFTFSEGKSGTYWKYCKKYEEE